jgi:hypothetical protein
VRWREELEEPLFVSRLDGKSRTENRLESRGSRDSVAVRAHIVKRHFKEAFIQSEQFFLHVIMCLLMDVFMRL